jgi:serine protease Do
MSQWRIGFAQSYPPRKIYLKPTYSQIRLDTELWTETIAILKSVHKSAITKRYSKQKPKTEPKAPPIMHKLANVIQKLSIPSIIAATLIGCPKLPWNINPLQPAVAQQSSQEQIATRLYRQSSPAVVTIKNGKGHGSGFLVSSDGLIITNAHVVTNGPGIVTVVFPDGRKESADVIGYAKNGIDLAALRIYSPNKQPTLPLAPPNSAQVGQSIFVIGTPLDEAYQNTLSEGIISRLNPKEGILQHDANTNPGNSGGPVLNAQGQVVGIHFSGDAQGNVYDGLGNVIGHTKSGINFAITLDRLQTFLQSVRQGNLSATPTLPSRQQQNPVTAINLRSQTLQGSFTKDSTRLPNGAFYHGYQFQGRAGQTVIIEMNSNDLDPTLVLSQIKPSTEGEEFVQIANNGDQGAGNFNAQIKIQLPTEGQYQILSSSSQAGEVGHYTLRVTVLP